MTIHHRRKAGFSIALCGLLTVLGGGCSASAPRISDDEQDADLEWEDRLPDAEPEGDAEPEVDAEGCGDEGCGECPPEIEVPTDEVCDDGLDNDCDGRVDEGCDEEVPPCVCLPGATRLCDDPSYSSIGSQLCDEGGGRWGNCREGAVVPEECRGVDAWYSPALERCLVLIGDCVQDMWDLDFDGDTWESVGACLDVTGCMELREESCGDLLDNDGDGEVDEGCGCLCQPGQARWCDEPSYGSLGLQRCSDDGQQWGPCREAEPPEVCPEAWSNLPEDQACLMEAGECVQDFWDLDEDGDRWESAGECPASLCFD